MIDYYHVLGLTHAAGILEVKAAYRKLAVRYHPDKNQGSPAAEERFKEINHAYHILSDPEKKYLYDLSLEQPVKPAPPSHEYARRRSRPAAHSRPSNMYDPRLERIGNIWALGFLFFTILLTVASTAVNTHFEQKRQREMLENNILLFEDARRDFNDGKYKAAIIKMNNMNFIYARDRDVFSFKEEIFRKVRSVADERFQHGAFRTALAYYTLLTENFKYVDKEVHYKIADCHRDVGNFEEAVRTLEAVASSGIDRIENYVKIAGIYKNDIHDYYYALTHYQSALNLIEAQYEGMYGKAFPALLNASVTPESHYEAYLGYAESLSYFGKYEEAMHAFDWAVYLRPYNPEALLMKGFCALKRDEKETACENFGAAAQLGSEQGAIKVKEYCN